MKLTPGKPLSEPMQELVRMELTSDQINEIARIRGFKQSYGMELFNGNINISERNTDLILEIVRKAIECRRFRFPIDV